MIDEAQEVHVPAGIAKLAEIICGCCSGEWTWRPIIWELSRLESETYAENAGLAAAVVEYVGMSEHGTSIRGGWLTPEGKAGLEFLRKYGEDWRSSDNHHTFIAPDGTQI